MSLPTPWQKINVNKLVEHHRRMSLKVDYKGDGGRKPLYSYAALICLAMRDAGRKMTLSQIYRWIRDNFAYYRTGDKSWQVSASPYASVPSPARSNLRLVQTSDKPSIWGSSVSDRELM